MSPRPDLRTALDPSVLERAASELLRGPVGTWDDTVLLAGGWYTHTFAGRAPRDLDLFCRDEDHLEAVAQRILARGGHVVDDRPPFFRRLAWEDQAIDLAYNVWCADLDEVFRRFDLGLSMVGIVWRDGSAQARVHPLAHASVAQGAVLIHLDCPNMKYALVIMERAHRYADRLALRVDDAGLAALWSVLENAEPEEQLKMLDRYRRVGVTDPHVEQRAMAVIRRGGAH